MLVKKHANSITIDELDDSYIIIALLYNEWHFVQKETYEDVGYLLLCLTRNALTRRNSRGSGEGYSLKYWWKTCDEMHAFTTTKEAFKFLIDKL